ncbi:CYTH domain-containing protein [Candidatus Curtissbacteria bacterium]|nr:CYTH domain-containing protein [Candidatus Curtissbacteria bacterium]
MQNKVNLELKYFCNDFSPIRKILKELNAKKVGTFFQKDYFFNLPQSDIKIHPRLKLRIQKGKQTIIYYKRRAFQENKSNQAKVSLLSVKDKKLLPYLKKVLGIKATVYKKRELWKKGNTIFNLDNILTVGKIFEIETTKNSKESEKEFNFYKQKFLPYLDKIIKDSNLDLILKKSIKSHSNNLDH